MTRVASRDSGPTGKGEAEEIKTTPAQVASGKKGKAVRKVSTAPEASALAVAVRTDSGDIPPGPLTAPPVPEAPPPANPSRRSRSLTAKVLEAPQQGLETRLKEELASLQRALDRLEKNRARDHLAVKTALVDLAEREASPPPPLEEPTPPPSVGLGRAMAGIALFLVLFAAFIGWDQRREADRVRFEAEVRDLFVEQNAALETALVDLRERAGTVDPALGQRLDDLQFAIDRLEKNLQEKPPPVAPQRQGLYWTRPYR